MPHRAVLRRAVAVAVLATVSAVGQRTLSLASHFQGDAVVLQKGVPVTVWGNSTDVPAGTRVEVGLDGGAVVVSATIGAAGGWRAQLPAQPTSWARELSAKLATGEHDKVTVKFGHLVLCSGQSNMQMPVNNWKAGGFCAENGTAEANAAGQYTGKISLLTLQTPFPMPTMPPWNGSDACHPGRQPCKAPMWNEVSPGPNGTLHGFSAVCWYSGKALFEKLGGEVPVGLLVGSVGGSPIEFWLEPTAPGANNTVCGVDNPPCDTQHNTTDSGFFNQFIKPLMPYTIGSVIWDQGERDVHCFGTTPGNRTDRYACMERELVRSWRSGFNSSFAFVTVQLPGYLGDCDSTFANPDATYANCVPGVFNMRLAQDAGADAPKTMVVPTYDLGCPFGGKTPECPFGSVHNVRKVKVGARIATQLLSMLEPDKIVAQGPRVASVTTADSADGSGSQEVTVSFAGGTSPFKFSGTQFCAKCCHGGTGSNDFDVSGDGGITFQNGTLAKITGPTEVSFTAPVAKVTHVRYTANQGFPQCALLNMEGLPALPFAYIVKPE